MNGTAGQGRLPKDTNRDYSSTMTEHTEVLIIGAGAAGLMCAAEAAKRGRKVLVIDRAKQPGGKIPVSGGGKCNFTNRAVSPEDYLSGNPRFAVSALSRYTNYDFITLVEKHGIPYEERDHGRLFCLRSARDILDMLLAECRAAGAALRLNTSAEGVEAAGGHGFLVRAGGKDIRCESLVAASGGTGGAGYDIARVFGLAVTPLKPGLVPLVFAPEDRKRFSRLAGISVSVEITAGDHTFRDELLFTHRGLSGPAVLQASLYWVEGREVRIDLLPGLDGAEFLEKRKAEYPGRMLKTVLSDLLPARLVTAMLPVEAVDAPLGSLARSRLPAVVESLTAWTIRPAGTEGYRIAEVTSGGVDCGEVSSKTFEARKVPGLYFIGEVLDVTGRLGGYNLQWAWSSGWCAGQYV